MKKRFIFLSILATLALTSCAGLMPQVRTPHSKSSSLEESEIVGNSQTTSAFSGRSSSSKSSSSTHVHTYDSFWSYDDDYHWHAANCEHRDYEYKDKAKHVFGDPYNEVPATCSTGGSYMIMCTICGYTKTVITGPSENHTWVIDDGTEIVQPTKEQNGSCRYVCAVCAQTKDVSLVYGETIETALTVDEALVIGEPLEHKVQTEISYYIRGRITEIVRLYESNNQATFWLASSSASRGFECYNINAGSLENLNSLAVGAEVLVFGNIYRYNTTIETTTGAVICDIHNEPVAITSLSFDTDYLFLPTGTCNYLNLSQMPYYANANVSWKIDNATVARVDIDTKKVNALRDGRCVITAFVDTIQNGQVDESEVSASIIVEVKTPDYFYDSSMLGYTEGNNINTNTITECTVGEVNFNFNGISALTSQNGCMRLNKDGYIKASNYTQSIRKIVLEPHPTYSARNTDFILYVGTDMDHLREAGVSSQAGQYIFTAEEDIHAYMISNPNTSVSYVNSISVYVDYEETNAHPNGTFSGAINLSDGSQIYACIALGETMAYVRIGADAYYTTYSYDGTYHQISLRIDDNYGTFSAIYKESRNMLALGHLSGPVSSSLAENGEIYLNGQIWLADCDGTDEELQTLFKRRRRDANGSAWVIDTEHEDRLTSYEFGVSGSAVKWRPWRDGAVALNLNEDFQTPIECQHFGYWVYNPSDNDVTLRMWMYKGTGHTSSMEIGSHVAKANQWTYCFIGFNSLMTYNFQIADFTYSGAALIFDNICFSY